MDTTAAGPLDAFDRASTAQRVMLRCDQIASHSDLPGATCRLYLTDAALEVNQLIGSWMSAAGMAVRVDQAGNLIGRRPAYNKTNTTKALVLGSHLDTVPGAGRYDGVLGVMTALAAVEALGDTALPFDLDVIGFSEEEGVRFELPYLGSAAVAGTFDPGWLDRKDSDGISMRDAIARCGLDPAAIAADAYEPQSVLGFAEVHLEQGPVLEHRDQPLGVVNAIQGQSRLSLRYTGRADHAGTVPMDHRRDALLAASRLVIEANAYGRSIDSLRATVGQIKAQPNVRNVVPAQVDLSLDVRHSDDSVRGRAVEYLLDQARLIAEQEQVEIALLEHQQQPAVQTDQVLCQSLSRAVRATGQDDIQLPSGAGHDAVTMSKLCPVAMLFVRHPGGVSHHPDEAVLPEDVGLAVEAITRFVIDLAEQH